MVKVVAGAEIHPGPCGEDDITAANLMQIADTLAQRPLADDERQELADILRFIAGIVAEIDGVDPNQASDSTPLQS